MDPDSRNTLSNYRVVLGCFLLERAAILAQKSKHLTEEEQAIDAGNIESNSSNTKYII